MSRRSLAPLEIALALCLLLPLAAAEEDGFRSIFNGKDLSGWDGAPGVWSVEDGTITGRTRADAPLKHNTFLIWRGGELDDFELRLSYRIVGGNSGIQYRSRELDDWIVAGYQADFEAGDTWSGILYEERGRGVLAKRGQKVEIGADGEKRVVGSHGDSKEIQSKIRKEKWNDYRIVARGNHLIHEINGVTTVEVVDAQKSQAARQGILALQCHAGPPMTVQFKNVRLERLPVVGAKKIVLVAGRQSHGRGSHEHNAGMLLFEKCLDRVDGILATTYLSGWPADPTAFDNADAIAIYSDGGGGHPILPHLDEVDALMRKGVGLGCIHYAVEVPKGKAGDKFLEWIGGYFEVFWSVNPTWPMKSPTLAKDHPITRGVGPIEVNDEWYYHMRFRDGMKGVTPILSAVPPDSTRERPDGAHSNNPAVRARKGMAEILCWAAERPGGGRGFGYTGGHFHSNWGNPNCRRLVLNALVWITGAEVPEGGVVSEVSEEDLEANLDPQRRRRRR